MPDEKKLKSHPYLNWLGSYIHDPNLWHLTRKSVSKAFFVGIFCAFLPLPSQMLIAAAASLLVRSNLPISVSLVWITNPFTIPPLFYFAYWTGTQLLGTPLQEVEFELTLEWFTNGLSSIWLPLIVGSLTCGTALGLFGYFCMQRFWIWSVNHSWKKRSLSKTDHHDSCQVNSEDSPEDITSSPQENTQASQAKAKAKQPKQ
ncbi:MAG: DUF2062 domain-containing protein [Amphritea sp.]